MERATQLNSFRYKEVTAAYRVFRANELTKKNIPAKENRIVCPMVEAGRSTNAYGQKFIPGLQSKDLKIFADALEVSPLAMKSIAYFSGKKGNIFGNILFGKFNDEAIKNGFIHTLKNGIHTGIYKDGKFNQQAFNEFVHAFHPKLKNVDLSESFLYSTTGNDLYLEDVHISEVIAYNKSIRNTKKVGLGEKLSTFEMEKLLLGLLGQELVEHPTASRGILVRDIYDLYKFGLVPASVEEKFATKNLVDLAYI